jgi:hypothetical protein
LWWSVTSRIPKLDVSRTTLLAATVAIEVWLAPPVPTVISSMPLTGSATPAGVCGAKR